MALPGDLEGIKSTLFMAACTTEAVIKPNTSPKSSPRFIKSILRRNGCG
jgi:hypothetical protein